MKQQVLVIGGGTTFKSYKDYISYLKTKEIDLEKLKARRDWKGSLRDELGENFEVFVPKMPNVTNARFKEWGIWFERILSLLAENIILIGYSLGGIFLVKYLSQNKVQKKIKATTLVAAPFDDKDLGESLAEFNLSSSLDNFRNQVGEIYLVHSKDDPIVPFGEIEKYKKVLPDAKTLVLEGMGHFKIEFFPQLVELVKSVERME